MSSEDESTLIKLNVGGVIHVTFLGTLRVHPDSHLAKTFSYPIAAPRDTRDGSYFLDRNGTIFGAILDYLRTGVLVVHRDPLHYLLLRQEICYYGLPIASQLPPIQPAPWCAAPLRYRHTRICVDELDKVIEWEEGTLPPDVPAKSISEIVAFFSARGYKIVSEYRSRGSKGLVSIWMRRKEPSPGADVPVTVNDPGISMVRAPFSSTDYNVAVTYPR